KDYVQQRALSSAERAVRTNGNSAEDSGHYSIRASADDIACLFSLPTCEEPHDHRDDDERYDTNPDIQRIDQTDLTWFFRCRRRRWRSSGWRRCISLGQHRLRILQALKRIIVLRVYF